MVTKRGKRQAKFYLSDEAIALLRGASESTTYDMSTIVDSLIKQRFGPTHRPADTPSQPAPERTAQPAATEEFSVDV